VKGKADLRDGAAVRSGGQLQGGVIAVQLVESLARVPKPEAALPGGVRPGLPRGPVDCATLCASGPRVPYRQHEMVAFARDDPVAAESAMKYFVLGAIASGCFLFGTSILWKTG